MDEEVLRRSLECPICLVIPRKVKIFSCQNGHTICEPCLTALPPPQNCPKGGCSHYNPGYRMLVLEGMIERTTMEVGCIMAREGCPVTMVQGKMLDEHESKCRFRKVKCICLPCPSEVRIENLLEHVKTFHQASDSVHRGLYNSSAYSIADRIEGDVGIKTWLPKCFSCYGFNFYAMLRRNGDFWFFWIFIESDQEEADQLKVYIEISNLKQDFKLEYTCHPVPMMGNGGKVSDYVEGNCLVLTTGQVKKLACVSELDKDVLELCISYDVSDDVAGLVDC